MTYFLIVILYLTDIVIELFTVFVLIVLGDYFSYEWYWITNLSVSELINLQKQECWELKQFT